MRQFALRRWVAMLATAMFVAPAVSAAALGGHDVAGETADMIGLADRDSGVRQSTRDRLSVSASSLTQSLASALQSDDPELRLQSAILLLNRRWAAPTDDDMVRQMLANYGTLDSEARCDQIDLLMGLPDDAGRPAVIRILRNDPSAAVRWAAMSALRSHAPAAPAGFAESLLRADESSTGITNLPLLALAGWDLRDTDPTRAERLLQQVVDAERRRPTAVRGQLDVVFLWLIDRATAAAQIDRVLPLLRQQASEQWWDGRSLPESVGAIVSLHAGQGPFEGLLDDLNAASGYWNRPELLYCVAEWSRRFDLQLLTWTADGLSMLCSGVSPESHEAVGTFLLAQGWVDPAEREFSVAQWLAGGDSVDAWFDLSRVAAMRDDDLGVATNLQEGLLRLHGQELHRTSRYGDVTPWTNQDAWAEVHWHFLRAAMKANDSAGIDLHLTKLMDLNKLNAILDSDPGLAADIVPALRTLGRNDEADRCFASAFKSLHDAVTSSPNDAEALNNLAWLCACTGEHLTEAEAWADHAVAAAPATAAYLDTAAEVRFRNHKPAEAAALETKAIRLTPEDAFMRHQLQTFNEAARTPARP